MTKYPQVFKIEQNARRSLSAGDLLVLLGIAGLLYGGVRVAAGAPAEIRGPQISLAPSALPYYASLSLVRMAAAYFLSLGFTLVYGRLAATHKTAEKILLPLLDILQSVPILSFLPVVLLSLVAVLPEDMAVELASIILIFTSQAWNMTYAWYQSLSTIPKELNEAARIFHLNGWMRFKTLELPFAAVSLIWNSIMSWAGGWFFLMAAEIFTVGQRDFRLPGLGAYLQAAAAQSNTSALLWGIATLILIVVMLDQMVWRPLLTWADRFKLEMVESQDPPSSWFYDLLRGSYLVELWNENIVVRLNERLDRWMIQRFPAQLEWSTESQKTSPGALLLGMLCLLGLGYGGLRAALTLLTVPLAQWSQIGLGVMITFLRVLAALVIALAWTVPLGVSIGVNRRLAKVLQPIVQVAASVPATALFPALLIVLLRLPAGLELGAVLLMLMGTQWYLLFNVIAGATAIPQDLKYTTTMLQIKGWQRWRTLILPSLFPYIITGAITASGGAWNASIVAEHITFGNQAFFATGIGALIARATASGDYPLLLAATLSMILAVVLINRLVWRRLYHLAEDRYRME